MDNKLFSIAQIRSIETIAIEKLAIGEFSLMQRAGEAAFVFLLEYWPSAKKICVLCGPGNNGGDGYIVAKLAHEAGLSVTIRTIGDVTRLKQPARQAFEQCQEAGIAIQPFSASEEYCTDVLVDAILGIGLKKEVSGVVREAILALNKSALPVLAIDVPSGLDADLGNVMGVAVQANITATFIGIKRGFLTNDGPDFCGKLCLATLNLPAFVFDSVGPCVTVLTPSLIRDALPARKQNSQKGNYGHVLLLGGNKGLSGAVRLAAEAALRVGAGLVSVATRAENLPVVLAKHPEIMCHAVENVQDLPPLIARATVLVIGPGLGQDDWSRNLLQMALQTPLPKVIDADGLNLLGAMPTCGEDWVLTPHPGEAARLLGYASASQVQQNRYHALDNLGKLGGVWVLKGAGSLIKSREYVYLCPFGNPGMASGGMGDVLSGIIGGLMAQKLNSAHAACLGVLVHALAGDKAAEKGQRGLLASDLIATLRQIVNPC